jgi:hypothetical protein
MLENLAIVAAGLKLGRYRHYKGKFYQVLAAARHSETREWVVVYRCLYDDSLYTTKFITQWDFLHISPSAQLKFARNPLYF